jgi:hypothetical protein
MFVPSLSWQNDRFYIKSQARFMRSNTSSRATQQQELRDVCDRVGERAGAMTVSKGQPEGIDVRPAERSTGAS